MYRVYSPNQEVLFQKGHQNRKYFSPRGHHTGSLIPEWSTQQEATFREGVDLFSLASYSLLSIHILSLYSNFVLESLLKAFPSFLGGRQCSEFFSHKKQWGKKCSEIYFFLLKYFSWLNFTAASIFSPCNCVSLEKLFGDNFVDHSLSEVGHVFL